MSIARLTLYLCIIPALAGFMLFAARSDDTAPGAAKSSQAATPSDATSFPYPEVAHIYFGGVALAVWPEKPSRDYADTDGFVYQLPAYIDASTPVELFKRDAKTGEVTFRFDVKVPEKMSESALRAARRAVIGHYRQFGIVSDQISEDQVALQRQNFSGYTVTAHLGNEKEELYVRGPLTYPTSAVSRIPVHKKLGESPFTRAVVEAPEQLQIFVDFNYRMSEIAVVTVKIELQNRIATKARETIGLTKAAEASALAFDRTAMQYATDKLESAVTLVVEESRDQQLNQEINSLKALIVAQFETLAKPVSIEDLKGRNVVVYTKDTARLELTRAVPKL